MKQHVIQNMFTLDDPLKPTNGVSRFAYIREIKICVVREAPADETLRHIRMPADVASFWKAQIINHSSFKEDREACYTLHLNAKNRLITWTTNTVGGIDSTIVNPGVVFREAIAVAARAIVLLHNHPSGDPTPSAEDLRITKQLIECGKILDINLMDHVILINSGDRHLSMRESGVMSFTS